MERKLAELIYEMSDYDKSSVQRIQHFIKVHNLCAVIGSLEGLDEDTLYTLETAAILHDIGIRPSLEKYGADAGHYQELEGPPEAEKMLRRLGLDNDELIDRVKFLVGHHHTYDNIDGLDYQILIEADFLVNLFENNSDNEKIMNVKKNIFKTRTGLKMFEDMFEH